MIKLTTQNGRHVWIMAQWITRVRETISGENGLTTIFIGAEHVTVTEPVEQVLRAIREELRTNK